ncbi:carboxypeptidase-like regulatory domain-containing protein [Bremerella volcania]|uniref:carboxypeptidase-like regulatory domain-containing protein n=1 Tax=Bremerella volcania TaxID=2527984 RepID=UPI001F4FE976|nr:carboxypeptidase-like regulatory domain-containing protein [Bremerella volcania]
MSASMKLPYALSRRLAATALASIALIGLVGCGSGSGVAPVSGTVTLDGEPLANALVSFYPQEEGKRFSTGTTDASGHYELVYTNDQQGAAIGRHTVKITTATVQGEGGPAKPPKEKLPAKYNDQSELVVEVASGSNSNTDFDLQSK